MTRFLAKRMSLVREFFMSGTAMKLGFVILGVIIARALWVMKCGQE